MKCKCQHSENSFVWFYFLHVFCAEREKLDLGLCYTLDTHPNTSMIRKPDLKSLLDVVIFILTWKAGKHDDIFFECSMLENRLHLSLMTHQDLSLGHDVIDTLCKISVYFHVKKNFLLCNVWDQLDHSHCFKEVPDK